MDFLQHVTHLDLRDNKLGDLDAMIFNNIEVLHCERNQLVTLNICGYFLKALYAASNGMKQTTRSFSVGSGNLLSAVISALLWFFFPCLVK